MRSSPAYAVSSLELPAVAAADRAAGVLVTLATLFLAWSCSRTGAGLSTILGVLLAGSLVLACLALAWRRSARAPARKLVALGDGTVWLHVVGQAPRQVTVGRGTRLLGPSVFLDLTVASPGSPSRIRCWILPFDAPRHSVRQWSVVLPRCARVACT